MQTLDETAKPKHVKIVHNVVTQCLMAAGSVVEKDGKLMIYKIAPLAHDDKGTLDAAAAKRARKAAKRAG